MNKKTEDNKFNEKRRKSPINLNKKISDEEKKRILKQKELEYNMGMAKKKTLDEKIYEENKKKNEDVFKNERAFFEKKYLIYIILIIILLFLISSFLSNPGKFNLKQKIEEKKIAKEKEKFKPEDKRIAEIKERLEKRKNDFNKLLLEQEKPLEFPKKFEIQDFIQRAYADNLIIEGIDEVQDNNIFIGDEAIKVEDFSFIFKDKYLRAKQESTIKEKMNIDEINPNIIFTKKYGIYTKEDELLVNILNGKAQNFDGFVDKNENPIVIAYDKKDGDITDKMKFEPKLENLKDGKTYKIKYKVTNSRGKTKERELKIKCVDIMKNLKRKK